MKNSIKILTISFTFIISAIIIPNKLSALQPNISFQVFYDELSPYGQWINYPNYGYAWIPDAGSDFVPYSSGGHWILTDYGWTWVSDYSWGWAPFHYGRWGYDNSYGWLWIPGYEWGPSWVSWRRADGYYGWRPLEPGVSINVSFGREYNTHNDHWMFVKDRDFDRSDVNHYYIDRNERERVIRNSSVINETHIDKGRNTTYVYGPTKDEVQKVTGRRVSAVAIQDNNKPGQDINSGKLRIYRPQVDNKSNAAHKAAPSKIVNIKDARRPSERKVSNQPQTGNQKDNSRKEQSQPGPKPSNSNNNIQPTQPQKANPSDNNRREQKQNNVNPQNNNSNRQAQPTQPQKANPSDNSRREQKQNNVNPQNNNTNKQVQPTQPQKANPPDKSRREQKPNNVNPQNNKNQAQPSQQRNAAPQENKRPEQQPNVVHPQNNNNNHAQPSRPQQSSPSEPRRQEQHQNNIKPENNNRNEQPKEPGHEQNNGRRN